MKDSINWALQVKKRSYETEKGMLGVSLEGVAR